MFWNLFKKGDNRRDFCDGLDKVPEISGDPWLPGERCFVWLPPMQRLDVKDGDIFVLKHPGKLSLEATKRLKETVEDIFKKFELKVRIVVFEEGMDIGVLRKEEGGQL